MDHNRKALLEIIQKYVSGKASLQQKDFLEAYDAFFLKEHADSIKPDKEGLSEILAQRIKNNINQRERNKISKLWLKIAAAASILIIFSIGLYLIAQKSNVPQNYAANHKIEIKPGSNKAFLILDNGQRISLSDAKSGTVATQAGKTIVKAADGKIKYQGNNEAFAYPKLVYNTIVTPRGGQYHVTLADGTKVLLNAESSLRYPALFIGKDRKVELVGEAYFEVAKDKQHPFIVSTDKQDVKVLGTHFNINSYSDEPLTKTTLIEGRVEVRTIVSNHSVILTPGQESVLYHDDLNVRKVNTEEAIAWKNGYFMFDNEDIRTIMRKVSRWYDVDIIYSEDMPQTVLYGTVNRFSSVKELLQKLELTGEVHFKVNGRRIMVSR